MNLFLAAALAHLKAQRDSVTALAGLDIRAGIGELQKPPQRGIVIIPSVVAAQPPANFGADRQVATVTLSALTFLPAAAKAENDIGDLEAITAAVRSAFIGWEEAGMTHACYYRGGELAQAPSPDSPAVVWRDDFDFKAFVSSGE